MMTEINDKTVVRHKYASESFAEKTYPRFTIGNLIFKLIVKLTLRLYFLKCIVLPQIHLVFLRK